VGELTDTSKPPRQIVKVMSTIFDLIPTYFDNAQRRPLTLCFMGHQGHARVEKNSPSAREITHTLWGSGPGEEFHRHMSNRTRYGHTGMLESQAQSRGEVT
jgi:hypothetical protein